MLRSVSNLFILFTMKKTTLFLFLVFVGVQTFAQTTSGAIKYAITEKIDPSRMKIVTVTSGGEGSGETPPPMPTTMDDERTLTFGGGFAKLSNRKPRMMSMNITSDGSGNISKSEKKEEIKMKMPFESRTFYNMNKTSKIQMLIIRDDEKGTEEAFFTEFPAIIIENVEYSDKTKDIAGFKCKKAIIKNKDEKVTIWYTTDIPYTFSPIEKYTLKEGFVLEIVSDDASYKALSFDGAPVKSEELIMPGGAKKVTKEEFDAKRKEAMAKFKPF
jgi:GLPGLI family protein